MKHKKFKIYTLGCKVNQYESQAMREQLEGAGLKEAEFGQKVDACIVNTCTVTSNADKKSRNIIRKLKRENPESMVLVTGCYAQADSEGISRMQEVDLIISNEEKSKISSYLVKDFTEISEFGISRFEGHTRAFVKIQDGCDNFCSFCKIPYVRGRSRSRQIAEVTEEVRRLGRNGYHEVVLTGICLGDYGKDLSPRVDLVDLIDIIEGIEGIWRIRLSSIEAKDINQKLILKIKESRKLCRHLHIPFQSGDDGVLRLMNRHFSRSQYLELVRKLRSEIDGIAVTADIIIGFPSEDERAFGNTLDLLKEVMPARVHIFVFAPRENTPLQDARININYANNRYRVARKFSDEIAVLYKKTFLGKDLEVLFEEQRGGLWKGYSSNYLSVFLETKEAMRNKLVVVKALKLFKDGFIASL